MRKRPGRQRPGRFSALGFCCIRFLLHWVSGIGFQVLGFRHWVSGVGAPSPERVACRRGAPRRAIARRPRRSGFDARHGEESGNGRMGGPARTPPARGASSRIPRTSSGFIEQARSWRHSLRGQLGAARRMDPHEDQRCIQPAAWASFRGGFAARKSAGGTSTIPPAAETAPPPPRARPY